MKHVNYFLVQALLLLMVACSGNEVLSVEQDGRQAEGVTGAVSFQRSEAEARKEALQFLARLSPEVRGASVQIDSVSYLLNERSVVDVRARRRRGEQEVDTLLFFINMREGGTIIASGSRAVEPVLAYLETDRPVGPSILREETGTGFDSFSRRISGGGPGKPFQRFIDYMVDGNGDTIGANRPISYSTFYITNEKCAPLLSVEWHQKWPYNIYAKTPDGRQSVAGCVPVAVGQIATYFKPSVILEGKKLDWNAMIADSVHPDIPKLLYYLGVSMGSEYGVQVTSTYLSAISVGFNAIGLSSRKVGPYDTQSALAELRDKHPVLLSGRTNDDDDEGHTWVVDGFLDVECIFFKHIGSPTGQPISREIGRENRLYMHCNWGSGKAFNGYFLNRVFTPYNKPWIQEEQEALVTPKDQDWDFSYNIWMHQRISFLP